MGFKKCYEFNELSSIEWFAELFALFVVNSLNYKEHITRSYNNLNCERFFYYFKDVVEVSDVATINLLRTFQNTIKKQLANIKKSVPIVRCHDNHVGSVNIANNIVQNPKLWFCRNLRINNHHIVNENKGLKSLKETYKTIVIILESPHKDEYDNAKCKIAPAPALGITGCNLDKGFVDILKDFMEENKGIIKDGTYQVILMNAIQFQCSLGLEPIVEKIKDEIFLSLWASDNIVENFKQRLEKYRPDIIINCCTNGDINKGMVNKIFEKKPKSDWAFSKYKQKILDITGHNEYFLYGFVQNVIEELYGRDKVEKLNCRDKVVKLRCTHPSSWARNKKYAKITNVNN